MPDKQLSIPGLETPPGSSLLSFSPPRKPAVRLVDRITFLEKRVADLELELLILKIQMEADHA